MPSKYWEYWCSARYLTTKSWYKGTINLIGSPTQPKINEYLEFTTRTMNRMP